MRHPLRATTTTTRQKSSVELVIGGVIFVIILFRRVFHPQAFEELYCGISPAKERGTVVPVGQLEMIDA